MVDGGASGAMRRFLRSSPLAVAVVLAVTACATPAPADVSPQPKQAELGGATATRPQETGGRRRSGGSRPIPRELAPVPSAPGPDGTAYELTANAAREAVRRGERRQALAAYEKFATEREAAGARSEAARAWSFVTMLSASKGVF